MCKKSSNFSEKIAAIKRFNRMDATNCFVKVCSDSRSNRWSLKPSNSLWRLCPPVSLARQSTTIKQWRIEKDGLRFNYDSTSRLFRFYRSLWLRIYWTRIFTSHWIRIGFGIHLAENDRGGQTGWWPGHYKPSLNHILHKWHHFRLSFTEDKAMTRRNYF